MIQELLEQLRQRIRDQCAVTSPRLVADLLCDHAEASLTPREVLVLYDIEWTARADPNWNTVFHIVNSLCERMAGRESCEIGLEVIYPIQLIDSPTGAGTARLHKHITTKGASS